MMSSMYGPHGPVRRYQCAICQREVEYVGQPPTLHPFCSPRCKLVDLGKWFREQYSIDGPAAPDDRGD